MAELTKIYESKEGIVLSAWPDGDIEIEDGGGEVIILSRSEMGTVIAELEAYWRRGDKPEGGV